MYWYFLRCTDHISPICRSRSLIHKCDISIPLVFVLETKDNDTFLLHDEGTNNLISIDNNEYRELDHIGSDDIQIFSSNGDDFYYTPYVIYNDKIYRIINLVEPDNINYFFPCFIDINRYWSIREPAPILEEARWFH